MKRFAPILLVFSGWIIAQFAGTPQQVYAQARTTLASLQAAIDNLRADLGSINNGTSVVPKAAEAEFAQTAGVALFAQTADVALVAQTAQAVPFAGITGLPDGLADGDQDTQYAVGAGLRIDGNTISIDFSAFDARYQRAVR